MKNHSFIGAITVCLAAASATLASPLPVHQAPIYGQESENVIPGHYIVVFKNGISQQRVADAEAQLSYRGGHRHHSFDRAVKGFSAVLPDEALRHLRSNPDIDYIEADQRITVSITASQPSSTWNLDRIDQRTLPLNGTFNYMSTGSYVTAYIIDTGIRPTHYEFTGRASAGFDALGGTGEDCNGHGTHVAGTIGGTTYGVAKNVNLVAVRVLDCTGSGTVSGVIAGVDWVTKNAKKPAVANMSLGGGVSTALDNAVKASIASGVTYAIAAGNNNQDACKYSPSRVPAAITVGATTVTDARASYSNFGSCLDIFAPGSSVTSAWYTSDSATAVLSGTSMATPGVTGVAAQYLE